MNPLNFYKHPDSIDYEKDIDVIGRDLIKQINASDYMRTTMYCSGHFTDEQNYPWKEAEMTLCLVALDIDKAYSKTQLATQVLRNEFGFSNVIGGNWYLYIDTDDNNKHYYLSELLVQYDTKEGRQKTVDILKNYF